MRTSMQTTPEPDTSPLPSLLALVIFIVAFAGLVSRCGGTTYHVSWDTPTDSVDHWIVLGPGDFPLALATTPAAVIESEQLTPITVVAVDVEGRMSEPSEPVNLPPAKGKLPVRVTLQRGGDLQGWEDVGTFYFTPAAAEFYRLKIETP